MVEILGYKLLQLRNPWGSGEWTGDWGDKSSKCTPRLRSLLNVTNEQYGIFWMSFDDYTNNFRSIYASIRLNDKYKFDEMDHLIAMKKMELLLLLMEKLMLRRFLNG